MELGKYTPMTPNPHNLVLEPGGPALIWVTDAPPYLFDLVPDKGREALGNWRKDQTPCRSRR
jgi:hypothetical protein